MTSEHDERACGSLTDGCAKCVSVNQAHYRALEHLGESSNQELIRRLGQLREDKGGYKWLQLVPLLTCVGRVNLAKERDSNVFVRVLACVCWVGVSVWVCVGVGVGVHVGGCVGVGWVRGCVGGGGGVGGMPAVAWHQAHANMRPAPRVCVHDQGVDARRGPCHARLADVNSTSHQLRIASSQAPPRQAQR